MAAMPHCVGVDYAGILADTNLIKARWIREDLGRDMPAWQCDRTSCVPVIGAEPYEAIANVVYEKEWSMQASPVAGTLDAVNALSMCGKLYVVSARLAHRIAFARKWLGQRGVARLVSGFLSFAGSDKKALCTQYGLQVLIDDDARHLEGLPPERIRPFLLKPGLQDELDVPAGVALCRTRDEVLSKIGLSP
ncbi:MAG: hypothetical protein O6950_04475 [Gammaproteobacteria bacterium]|nr:hypothetical protein [Gammaproteobacteria bacterium]